MAQLFTGATSIGDGEVLLTTDLFLIIFQNQVIIPCGFVLAYSDSTFL